MQKRLINAQEGEQVLLPAGTFNFKRELYLTDLANITIKGAGKGKTILSFKDQIDGAQGMSHDHPDVQELACDFYVFSGHKVFAPTGIGALWGKMEHLEAMPPWYP